MAGARAWQVYLLECCDDSLYTGVAIDVARRYAQHVAGKGAKYTRSRPPRRLLAVIEADGRSSALRTEHAIKQLLPADKRALARQHPPAPELLQAIASTSPARADRGKLVLVADTSTTASPHGASPMPKIGDQAPAFSLASDSGAIVASASLKGQRYVLYFYPKDDTPGCTKEACAFRDLLPDFGKLGVPVFGVSADSEKAHAKFSGKYRLNFPLLADPDRALIEAYGAWVEKSLYGRKYMGIARCTFVVGVDGRIEQAWDKVKPEAHAGEVLAWLAGGGTGTTKAATPAGKKAAGKPAAVRKAAVKKTTEAASKVVAKKAATAKPAAVAKKTATAKAKKIPATTGKAPSRKAPATKKAVRRKA